MEKLGRRVDDVHRGMNELQREIDELKQQPKPENATEPMEKLGTRVDDMEKVGRRMDDVYRGMNELRQEIVELKQQPKPENATEEPDPDHSCHISE